ncbi:MAG: transcription elongation factor GreA [Deltaproteobacteria bacterium]|nr:transcription elongation factor GreA [Deltaproteobacteria bacterium]
MQPTIPMTPSGHARLKEELQTLKSVERPKVIQAIATAREHGDLRENAEYHAARERQSFIEGRIQHLDSVLAVAEVIDPSLLSGPKVAFGCTVRISNVDTGEEVTYRLVGPEEADIEAGSISISSPLARQLIGRETGDEVQVRTPGGQRNYEVLEVSWR